MDREAWHAVIHGVAKSRTRLSNWIYWTDTCYWGFSGGLDGKRICLWWRRPGFDPWVGENLWWKELLPTPVLLPGESHGQRSLTGCSPWSFRVRHDWATKHMVIEEHTSVQFSSVAQSYPTLCDPMDCSTPCLHVHHHLPESIQTHVYWVGDAIQPSHPLLSPSPPAFNLS